MALVRILVDGYSLLHGWPGLVPGQARHSAAARAALIQKLTHYRDACGTPISLFFDGSQPRRAAPPVESTPLVEVVFSRAGQTADDLIERAAYLFQDFGEVLVVTDDIAERETVMAFGASAASCDNFIALVESALTDFAFDLKHYNRAERNRFNQRH